jgi:hypothetical protein
MGMKQNAEKLPELIFYKTVKKNEIFPQFCTFLGGFFQCSTNLRSAKKLLQGYWQIITVLISNILPFLRLQIFGQQR